MLGGGNIMNEEEKKKVVQHIITFYTIFQKEIVDVFQDDNSELSPLLSRALHEVYYTDNITPSILSKRLLITIPNTSRCLKQLYKSGYILKDKDENDRRITHIKLTAKGLEFIHKTISHIDKLMFERLSSFDSNKLNRISEAFSLIEEIFEK